MTITQRVAWTITCDADGCEYREDWNYDGRGNPRPTVIDIRDIGKRIGWETDGLGKDYCPEHVQSQRAGAVTTDRPHWHGRWSDPEDGPEHRDCLRAGWRCTRCGYDQAGIHVCERCGHTETMPLFVAPEAAGGAR